jgi:hypothetical protein
MTTRQDLQQRIDDALRETQNDFAESTYSDYADSRADLTQRLYERALPGQDEAAKVEAVLDEFETLMASEDKRRAQRALASFVTHHPAAARLGLRVPDLEQRAGWKARPSRSRKE